MPVAHGHKTARVDSCLLQPQLQSQRLLLGKPPDRRASPDRRVMVLYLPRACARNQFGQRFAPDAGEREVNNIGVAKQIKKKWLDGLQRVRPAKLEENHTCPPC